jgi:chromosomal replication initiator protein
VAKDDKDIMSALRRAVADRVGNERYSLWFGPRTRFVWDGTELSIYAPNPFFREWIRTVFACAIEEACQSVIGWIPKITFVCDDESAQDHSGELALCGDVVAGGAKRNGTRRQPQSCASSHRSAQAVSDASEALPLFRFASLNESERTETVLQTPGVSSPGEGLEARLITKMAHHEATRGERDLDQDPTQAVSTAMPSNQETACLASESQSLFGREAGPQRSDRRAVLERHPEDGARPDSGEIKGPVRSPKNQLRPGYDLNSFVVGDCNRLAFAAADAVVRMLGTYSPLVFHGPSGVGKTHLLEGIWRAVKQRHPRIAAIYLSAEQFTTAYVEALHKGGIPVFRQKYRGLQLFLLDDLHFFVGKRQTQIELLYTIDSLLKTGCQIVCAADRPPCEIRELSQELVSRLEGGVVCRVDPPDLAVRAQIVARLVRETGVSLSAEVQAWIAERFTRNVRQVIGAVRRLEAAARALRRPLDVSLAEEILGDMLGDACCQINLPDIEREVCHAFGLPQGALQTNRKDREITYPRMLAMWLARKYTRANLVEIGRYFGKRSHATVISAQKKVESWMREGYRLSSAKGERSVHETLKELERRLRAG